MFATKMFRIPLQSRASLASALARTIGSLPCAAGRVLRSEHLESAEPTAAEKNLRDIARINRLFGGHRTVLNLLRQFVEPADVFSILDVGAASGDVGKCIVKRYGNAKVTSLDRVCLHLKKADPPKVAGDAFALPFADGSFDFVMCSLFLHHFSDNEVIDLLREMRRLTRRALIVLDLERHPLAYCFLPLTRMLFDWSDLTVHDGRVSVEAAFKREELASLGLTLAPAWLTTRRHLPWFRLSLVMPGQ
jgi:2-polyprenyl-3-methyl-5-hydroxy-6-metoxy-1,4-benzoquinol methylase